MERSEPTLIPEWLKSSGSANGGTTAHPMASSSSHLDGHAASKPSRNKLPVSPNDHDVGRSFVSDRTTSSYFGRSLSSNGSAYVQSHGSFGRSNRVRDWEKEIYEYHDKEKSILGDHRRHESSDPLEKILPSRFEQDLRRSQSMITGKPGKTWPRKIPADPSNASKNNPINSNGLLARGSAVSSVHKAAFERDFPSLAAEEIGRASSPGLSTAIQSLPMGTSAEIGGNGWTSALAEVPASVRSNDIAGSVQQAISPTSSSLTSSMMTGLNMAETLAQGPSHSYATTSQPSGGTQRMEELAIKQSRQLIPMTPSLPKPLVLNPSEKPKPKIGQPPPPPPQLISSSHLANHSPRSGTVKSDVLRVSSVGKLHVLKPARERNGASPTAKDNSSPTRGSRVASNPVAVAPSAIVSTPLWSPSNNPNLSSANRKADMGNLEKRPTPQAQSRNEFFNQVRKKSMTSPSLAAHGPDPSMTPTVMDKSDGTESGSAPVMPGDGDSPLLESFVGERSTEKTNGPNSHTNDFDRARECLNDRHQEPLNNGKDQPIPNAILYSEEEEAAFLRSLGWEENDGEDEGLTEEEINSFYKEVDEYIKLKPSLRVLRGMQLKILVPLNPHIGGSCGSSSSNSRV